MKSKPTNDSAIESSMPKTMETSDETTNIQMESIDTDMITNLKRQRKTSLAELMPDINPTQEVAADDYMNTDMRQHFAKLLNDWKQQLMQEVDRTVGHMKDEAANFPDPTDRATQEEEFSLELRARDRERKLIKKIDEALQRIDEDDYGYCEACGVEIGTGRLEARPTATLCIDCKTVDEIKERQITL